MPTKRDFYEILGVSKTATEAEIKAAYRKLALKWHPDKHPTDKEKAEAQFKEINEAYQVLSDKSKRSQYDQFGHAAFDPASGFGGGNPFGGFRQGPFTWSYSSSSGNPFEGADFGDPFEIFEQFFGGGFGGARRQRRQHVSITITFEEALHGVSKEITVDGKKRTIKIPAGADDGTRIRYDEFEVSIDVQAHPKFKRDGVDLYVDHTITYSMAVLGGVTEVETPDKPLQLKVRPGVQSHSLIRLRSEGVPSLRGGGKGDLYVRLIIKVPEELSKKQKKAVEELEALGL